MSAPYHQCEYLFTAETLRTLRVTFSFVCRETTANERTPPFGENTQARVAEVALPIAVSRWAKENNPLRSPRLCGEERISF